MTYVLLFISLTTGQPLTGDGNVLVFPTREACEYAGHRLLDVTVAEATFRFECISAQKAT